MVCVVYPKSVRTSFPLIFAIIASCAVSVCGIASSAEYLVDTESADQPLIKAVYAPVPPRLDGVLDDDIWKNSPRLENFYATDLDRAPTERTVVWLAYDDSYIYWAARVSDSEPTTLRMEQTRRGGSVRNDDYIALGFDVGNQHRHDGDYVFRVTPSGVQDERVPDGAATKVEWRGDWRTAARVDSTGWTVEVAIPLRMFRLAEGPHTIGVSAFRWHPRTNERIRWPNMGSNWDRTKAGDWVGVVWPKLATRPQIMPYVVGERSGGLDDGYMGADAKYVTPGGVTYVATAYPDFQNVENDVLGLDFSYSQRFQKDNRPFFVEGRRYLPEFWMFYTNNVGELFGGAKVFGQTGNHRLGLLEVYDRDEVNHMAGQWYWQPFDRIELENKFSWRHGDASTIDIEEKPQVNDNIMYISEIRRGKMVGGSTVYHRIQGGITRSDTVGTNGWNVEASYSRFPANGEFGGFLRGRLLSPGFITIDGLLDANEADQRDVNAQLEYAREYDRYWLRGYGIEIEGRYATRFDRSLFSREAEFGGWVDIIPGGGIFSELFLRDRPPYQDRTLRTNISWLNNTLYSSGRSGVRFGKLGGADYFQSWLSQGFHVVSDLSMGVRFDYRRRDLPVGHEDLEVADVAYGKIEHQYLSMLTAQYDLTTERAVSGRVIYTHSGWNGYVTFQQVVRKGMDLFLIIGDPSEDTWRTRVALKAMIVL
jgi:hypothetical protein